MEWVGKRKKLIDLMNKWEIPQMDLGFTNGHILTINGKKEGRAESLWIDLETLRPKYKVIENKREHIQKLKEQIERADEVIVMTDADYEWEVIAFCLYSLFKDYKHKFKRAITLEVSWPAINKALENKLDSFDQNNVDAWMIRAFLDRLIWWGYSSVVYKKGDGKLTNVSAGRCQSPTLKFLTEREREIKNFTPKDFWWVHLKHKDGLTSSHILNKTEGKNGEVCFNKEDKDKLEDKLKDCQVAVVTKVSTSLFETKPKEPFNNASLLSTCASVLWMDAEKITKIGQELYEKGYVSYIRTDAVELEPEKIAEIQQHIFQTYGEEYLPKTPHKYKNPDSAQASHMAIAPVNMSTEPWVIYDELWKEHGVIYEIIYRRVVASQMSNVITEKQVVELEAEWEKFTCVAKKVVFNGFREEWYYTGDTEDDDGSADFASYNEWDIVPIEKVVITTHKTKAPSRYNVGSCVAKMDKLRIGRPATIPMIIKTLEEREYIEIGKKSVISVTEKWEEVMDIINSFADKDIMDFDYTKSLEDKRDNISKWSVQYIDLATQFYEDIQKTMNENGVFIDSEGFVRIWAKKVEETTEECPLCRKGKLIIIDTKKWKWIKCSKSDYKDGKHSGCKYFNFLGGAENTWEKCPYPNCSGELYTFKTKTGKMVKKCQYTYYDSATKQSLGCPHKIEFL